MDFEHYAITGWFPQPVSRQMPHRTSKVNVYGRYRPRCATHDVYLLIFITEQNQFNFEYTWCTKEPVACRTWRYPQNRKYKRQRRQRRTECASHGHMQRAWKIRWNSVVWFFMYAIGLTNRVTNRGGSSTSALGEDHRRGQWSSKGHRKKIVGHMLIYAVFDVKPTHNHYIFYPKCPVTLPTISFQWCQWGTRPLTGGVPPLELS